MQAKIDYVASRGFTIALQAYNDEEISLLRAFAEFSKKGKIAVGEVKRIDKSNQALQISSKPIETKQKKKKEE